VDDLVEVGAEPVAGRSVGERADVVRTSGDLRLAGPPGLGTVDRVDRGAVEGEPRVPAEIRALASARH
jgi:hypothetical protein